MLVALPASEAHARRKSFSDGIKDVVVDTARGAGKAVVKDWERGRDQERRDEIKRRQAAQRDKIRRRQAEQRNTHDANEDLRRAEIRRQQEDQKAWNKAGRFEGYDTDTTRRARSEDLTRMHSGDTSSLTEVERLQRELEAAKLRQQIDDLRPKAPQQVTSLPTPTSQQAKPDPRVENSENRGFRYVERNPAPEQERKPTWYRLVPR